MPQTHEPSRSRSPRRWIAAVLGVLLTACLPACRPGPDQPPPDAGPEIGRPLAYNRFLTGDGRVVDLLDNPERRATVLVFMRGFAGFVCPNCLRQTAEIIENQPAFDEARSRVFVVYPGPADQVPAFLEAVRQAHGPDAGEPPPLQLLLDVDLEATRALGIEGQLAQPSTFILDPDGHLAYRYVGLTPSDRPPTERILEEVRKLRVGS